MAGDARRAAAETIEIVAHGFFAPNDLPSDTGRATRARIAEVLDGVPLSELW